MGFIKLPNYPIPQLPISSFRVPSNDFYRRLGRSQFAGAVGGRDLPLFAGHQGNVIVFPDDWENLFSPDPLIDLQPHKEGETFAWVLKCHMGDLFFTLAFAAVSNLQFYFGQLG